jgi:hypothetical protein
MLLWSKGTLDKFGRDLIGFPDNTQFVTSKSGMDDILRRANGDISKIEKELGIPNGAWQGREMSRIDIPNPKELDLRLPSGNEMGANKLWLPGGKTINGKVEAVVNRIPEGSYLEKGIN